MRTPLPRPLAAILLCLLPVAGAALELKPLWRVPQPATISASPTLWSDGTSRGVVVCSDAGTVTLYDPAGKPVWSYQHPRGMFQAAAAVADLDGEGRPETVAAGSAGELICLDAKGALRWQRRLPARISWASPLVADLEGDRRLEVAAGDARGFVSVFDHAGRLLWRFESGKDIAAPLGAADVDGDGRVELLVPCESGTAFAVKAGGRCLWAHRERATTLYCAPAAADLEGDGRMEVLEGFADGRVVCLDGPTGRPRWSTDIGEEIDSAISVADVDRDGKLEVLAGDKTAAVTCLGPEGGIRWRAARGAASVPRVVSAPAVADLDGDGRPEVLFGYHDFGLSVTDAKGGVLMEMATRGGMNSTPLVADLTGDGKLEVVVTGINELLCLGAPGEGRVQWAAYRNTPQVTGAVGEGRRLPQAVAAPSRQPGPALRLAGVEGPESLLAVGPAAATGLVQARLVRPDGVVYATAAPLRAGEALTLRFQQLVAGRYRVEATALTPSGVRTSTMSKHLGVLSLHLEAIRQDCAKAWQVVSALDQGPASRGAGLLARLGMLEGMAARLEHNTTSMSPEAVAGLAETAAGLVADARHLAMVSRLAGTRTETFPCLIWQANPWRPFDARDLPEQTAADGTPVLPPLYQSERHPLCLNMLNLSERTLGVRVEPGDLETGAETLPWQGRVKLLTLRAVGSRALREVWDALPTLGHDRLLEIPTLEARQLWVMLDTTGLAPGRYRLPLKLLTTEQDHRERTLSLDFEVLPLDLAQGQALRFCQWGYFFSGGNYLSRCQEAAVADMVAHGTNVYVLSTEVMPVREYDAQGNPTGPAPDWAEHDRVVRLCSPHGILLYCGYQSNVRGPAHGTPAWERAHAHYIRELVAHLAGMGIGYDGFAMYPVDEPGLHPGLAQYYISLARQIRAADPRVLVYTDPVLGMTPEELREAAPYTDIWCPNDGVVKLHPERIAFLRATGNPVWTYACGGGAKTELSMTKYYRWLSWLAWDRGLSGVGFWTYCTTAYHPWQGDEEGEGEYVLVYPGDTPVSSRRWEAAFAGLQDYRALDLLRQALTAARGKVDSATLQAAETALAAAVKEVMALEEGEDDFGAAMARARQVVAEWTMRLRSAK